MVKKHKYPDFYKDMCELIRGTRCSECGRYLSGSSTEVAHILSKSISPEVAVNPMNIIGLCGDCHTKFDYSLQSRSNMKVFPITLNRFKEYLDNIVEKPTSEVIFYRKHLQHE